MLKEPQLFRNSECLNSSPCPKDSWPQIWIRTKTDMELDSHDSPVHCSLSLSQSTCWFHNKYRPLSWTRPWHPSLCTSTLKWAIHHFSAEYNSSDFEVPEAGICLKWTCFYKVQPHLQANILIPAYIIKQDKMWWIIQIWTMPHTFGHSIHQILE